MTGVDLLAIMPSTLDDVPKLVSLVNSAYRGEGAKQGWTTEADLLGGVRTDEESIKELIGKSNAVILKCVDEENELVGCVYLKNQLTQLYLGMLTVAPGKQARGIGKRLLAASEAYARQQGCPLIIMTVISVRHELINWYERHGYINTGEKKPFPDDPRFGIPKQPLEFVVLKKML